MRLLNAEAFIKEPGGTVYSFYYPSVTTFQGLSIKGETTHTTRFRQQPLLNTIDVDTDAEATAALERTMKGGSYGVAFDMEAEESIDPAAQYYYAVFDPEDVDKLVARLQQAAEAVRTAARVAAFFAPITYPSEVTNAEALHSVAELFAVNQKVLAVSYIGTNVYPPHEHEESLLCRNTFPVTVKHPVTGKLVTVAVDFFDIENESSKDGIPNDHAQELFDCFLNDVRAELHWTDCDNIIHVPNDTIPDAFAFVKRASEWTALIEKQQAEDQPIESKE